MEADLQHNILMAEDDADYFRLVDEALKQSAIKTNLRWVENGEACMQFFRENEKAANPFMPGLILMDLNMPRKNGYETLNDIKKNPALRHIPVVMMTISRAPEDILMSYMLGASSFITKPLGFQPLVETMRAMTRYWFQVVSLSKSHKII